VLVLVSLFTLSVDYDDRDLSALPVSGVSLVITRHSTYDYVSILTTDN
jgi:hypothetical protein